MEANIISHGIDLMLYGMGTVFVFLTVLVGSTSLMSTIVGKYFPEVVETEVVKRPPITNSSHGVDSRTLSIIQEAIIQHRATTK